MLALPTETLPLALLEPFLLLRQLGGVNLLVGGCVRDMLLGVAPKDFDIVTDHSMAAVTAVFQDHGWQVKEVGLRFQVAHVSKGDAQFEIARFRKDVYQDGACNPVPGDIQSDSARRDFTVNALYLEPWSGRVIDQTGQGIADCQSKTLRFVGKPAQRIAEDPMRVLRFYRFIARKGLKPVAGHLRAVRTEWPNALARLLTEFNAAEGMREEIEKLVGGL